MILTKAELLRLRKHWQQAGQKIVFTNGVFDLIHLGHIRYLAEAKKLGEFLIVGLNSDNSVRELKGPLRPLVPENERAEVIHSIRPVDCVVIFEERTAELIVSELEPEVYVKGGDYSLDEINPDHKFLPEAKIVQAYGGKVVLIPFLPEHSTSELISKILESYRPIIKKKEIDDPA